jgi:hypothetical protein
MEKLRPDIYQESLESINFDNLKGNGIKLLLIDMDNTILKYGENIISDDIKNKINSLKNDFKIIIFSNSLKKRVKKYSVELDVSFISFACKPSKKGFLKVFKDYKIEPCDVAVIGDQILTDIKGGNKVGITTILVKPLSKEDNIITKINRRREEKIYKKMGAKGLLFKERFYE